MNFCHSILHCLLVFIVSRIIFRCFCFLLCQMLSKLNSLSPRYFSRSHVIQFHLDFSADALTNARKHKNNKNKTKRIDFYWKKRRQKRRNCTGHSESIAVKYKLCVSCCVWEWTNSSSFAFYTGQPFCVWERLVHWLVRLPFSWNGSERITAAKLKSVAFNFFVLFERNEWKKKKQN